MRFGLIPPSSRRSKPGFELAPTDDLFLEIIMVETPQKLNARRKDPLKRMARERRLTRKPWAEG